MIHLLRLARVRAARIERGSSTVPGTKTDMLLIFILDGVSSPFLGVPDAAGESLLLEWSLLLLFYKTVPLYNLLEQTHCEGGSAFCADSLELFFPRFGSEPCPVQANSRSCMRGSGEITCSIGQTILVSDFFTIKG